MGSARPSSFKKGGGFLNQVDGIITGYEFSDEFNGRPFTPGRDPKTKKERFHSLYTALSVRVDGADEDVTTTLFSGGADDYEISDDGLTLTPVEEGNNIGANTGLGRFIISLCEAGFPETRLPEDTINFEAMVGTRCRFVQRTDEEATKKLGKRRSKDGKKEYDRQYLVVDQVYELPELKSAAKTAQKTANSSAAKLRPVTKGNGRTKAAEETDDASIEALATETLLSILAETDGAIPKSKLSLKVLTKLMKHPQREAVRKLIYTDDFLSAVDGVEYDPSDKNQTVSLTG